MSQLDNVKSQIDLLKHGISVLVTINFISIGFLVRDYREGSEDFLTLISIALSICSAFLIVYGYKQIIKRQKELKDL